METTSALELERDGEYEAAAAAYAVDGFERIVRSKFELSGPSRVGIGMLLQAISCDVRSGNTRRAEQLFHLVEPLLRGFSETADETVVRGLCLEWLGDGALMVRDEESIAHYRAAADQYSELSWQDETWQDEPEFMHAFWAIQEYARSLGYELSPPDYSHSFTDRIDSKLVLAGDVLDVEST